MQSPEDTVAESTDNTGATNPVDRPRRRRPLHARIRAFWAEAAAPGG